MDKNYEKRMLLAFVLSFVLFGITFFLIPKKEDKPKDYTAQVQQTNTNANAALTTNVTYNTAATNAAPVKKPATTSAISNVYETLPITEAKIGYSNQLSLTVSSFAGRWANVQINGEMEPAERTDFVCVGRIAWQAGRLCTGRVAECV